MFSRLRSTPHLATAAFAIVCIAAPSASHASVCLATPIYGNVVSVSPIANPAMVLYSFNPSTNSTTVSIVSIVYGTQSQGFGPFTATSCVNSSNLSGYALLGTYLDASNATGAVLSNSNPTSDIGHSFFQQTGFDEATIVGALQSHNYASLTVFAQNLSGRAIAFDASAGGAGVVDGFSDGHLLGGVGAATSRVLLDGLIIPAAPTTAPEPSTWALMAGGLGLLGAARRRVSGQRAA